MRRLGAIGVILAVSGVWASSADAGGVRQVVKASFTTARTSAPTGVQVSAVYVPASAGGLPHSLRHVSDGLPVGTTLRAATTPKCAANDLELMILGPSACPQGSVVGTGTVLIDFGIGPPGRLDTSVTLINSGKEILFLGREPHTGIGLVDHGVIHGSTIEIDIPQLPGASAEGASVDMESFSITKSSGLLVSPARCPRSRHWTFRRGHTYGDGVTQFAEAPIPCRRPRGRPRRSP